MTDNNQNKSESTFLDRLSQAFLFLVRIFLRLMLVLIILGGIAAVVYWGVPYLYRSYVRPVEENTAEITNLGSQQETTTTLFTNQIDDLQSRMDSLELKSDSRQEKLAEIEAILAEQKTLLDETVADLSQFEEINTQLTEQQDALVEIQADILALDSVIGENSVLLETLTDKPDLAGPMEDLQYSVLVLRAMELITRSRLSILQSNFGNAAADIDSLKALLTGFEQYLPEESLETIDLLNFHLDLAKVSLPAKPELAEDNLDIVWQVLVEGIEEDETSSETESLDAETPETMEITPTPSP